MNRNGVIDAKDVTAARQNLAVATTERPPNRAPVLAPIGPLAVMPGGTLAVSLHATDPDGDPVTFTLPNADALPTGSLDAMGTLRFMPTPNQLGTYNFSVVASDGQFDVSQSVTLDVVADPLTTTRLSGVLNRVTGQPLAGVMIEVGAVQALTAANGSFTLDFGAGPVVSDTVRVRAELLAGSETFPFIAEKIELLLGHALFANVNNVIDRPIFLPALDTANAVQIDPNQDATVTTPLLPGRARDPTQLRCGR